MTLQEQIKKDKIQAMKEKNTLRRDLLGVVLGEFNQLGKEVSDSTAMVILKKMIKNATELNNEFEVKELEKYMPAMLGPNQTKVIIAGIISSNGFSGMQDMGKVMGEIKKIPSAAQIDGKLASGIVKQLLTK